MALVEQVLHEGGHYTAYLDRRREQQDHYAAVVAQRPGLALQLPKADPKLREVPLPALPRETARGYCFPVRGVPTRFFVADTQEYAVCRICGHTTKTKAGIVAHVQKKHPTWPQEEWLVWLPKSVCQLVATENGYVLRCPQWATPSLDSRQLAARKRRAGRS